MQNKLMALVAIGLILVVGAGCMFSTSSTTIIGVVDNYGKPVEGAEVSFGPTLGEVKTATGKDGKFTLTANHGPITMLYLKVNKKGYAQREKIEFPGFAAPEEEIKVEMLETVSY